MHASDPGDIPQLLRSVGSSRYAHVRMALTRADDDVFELRSLIIDVFPDVWFQRPETNFTDWQPVTFLHEFPQAFFFADLLPSSEVQLWLSHPEDCELKNFETRLGYSLRVLRFRMPALHQTVIAQSMPCYGLDGFVSLPWPHTFYKCHIKTDSIARNGDAKPLVSGLDYFRSFTAARAKLVHGVTNPHHIYNCEDAVAARVVHPEAWLSEVLVSKTRITATVAGLQAFGTTRVVLTGDQIDESRAVPPSKFVTFDLDVPLPSRLTITLVGDKRERMRRTTPMCPLRPRPGRRT